MELGKLMLVFRLVVKSNVLSVVEQGRGSDGFGLQPYPLDSVKSKGDETMKVYEDIIISVIGTPWYLHAPKTTEGLKLAKDFLELLKTLLEGF